MSWRFVAVASEAAVRAGEIQREHYGQDVKVEKKGDIDLVTEVDHACEAAILEVIRDRFPEHDILAEESASARTGSRTQTMKRASGRASRRAGIQEAKAAFFESSRRCGPHSVPCSNGGQFKSAGLSSLLGSRRRARPPGR